MQVLLSMAPPPPCMAWPSATHSAFVPPELLPINKVVTCETQKKVTTQDQIFKYVALPYCRARKQPNIPLTIRKYVFTVQSTCFDFPQEETTVYLEATDADKKGTVTRLPSTRNSMVTITR